MKTEQEKLVLSNYEWAVLIKKISSMVNKAIKIEEHATPQPALKGKRIKEMGLECLEIIKYKNIKK